MNVVIDGFDPDLDAWTRRTMLEAPDIDPIVFVQEPAPREAGSRRSSRGGCASANSEPASLTWRHTSWREEGHPAGRSVLVQVSYSYSLPSYIINTAHVFRSARRSSRSRVAENLLSTDSAFAVRRLQARGGGVRPPGARVAGRGRPRPAPPRSSAAAPAPAATPPGSQARGVDMARWGARGRAEEVVSAEAGIAVGPLVVQLALREPRVQQPGRRRRG